jgi:SNF2 family DNA or RNA helicase
MQMGQKWLVQGLSSGARLLVLGDARGLGKSTQVVCAVKERADAKKPVLVVCPRERCEMCFHAKDGVQSVSGPL